MERGKRRKRKREVGGGDRIGKGGNRIGKGREGIRRGREGEREKEKGLAYKYSMVVAIEFQEGRDPSSWLCSHELCS